MLERLLTFSLKYRFLILIFAALIVGAGIMSLKELPIDAVPDITTVQVQVLTRTAPMGPVEVERYVTFPVEAAMSGIPNIEGVRSISRFGLSAVTVVFKEHVNIYWARQQVSERLVRAREEIPQGFGTPESGPVSTGLGEVYQFVVRGKGYSPMELRTILDWQIGYRLRSVPGVVEISQEGGYAKQYQVVVDPAKLVSYRIPISQVFEALEKNNAVAGGGYIEHAGEAYIIRGEGLVQNPDDISRIIVDNRNSVPVTVAQLGEVKVGNVTRIGAATMNGEGEAVIAMTLMLAGENGRVVAERVKAAVKKMLPSLPPGISIEPFYDRSELVNKVIKTVATNLTEGAILVIAVLFFLLGDLRGGLIVASAIPLSMLIAFTGMLYAGVSGNLMSLGAIDFGLIVDGAVVMIENITRHLSGKKISREQTPHVILQAGREVLRPIFFAVGIIIIVYLPILTLEGVEGKMFRPMALTVIFALVGSLVLTFTLMPVLASFFMRAREHESETWLIRKVGGFYRPLLAKAVARPLATATIAAAVFVSSLVFVPFMGSEFIPRLDEGDITVQAWRLPSIALGESLKSTLQIEKTLLKFPEVTQVVSRTGTPEVATDVMGMELSDIFVKLKPRGEWTTAENKEELVEKMSERLAREVPGVGFGFTQPIEMRFNEMIAGARADVALKIFGDDLDRLKDLGDQAVRILSAVPGAADVRADQVAGLPMLSVKVDREKIARYGIAAESVLAAVEAGGAGRVVGTVFEGQRRFGLAVRLKQDGNLNPDGFASLPVAGKDGILDSVGTARQRQSGGRPGAGEPRRYSAPHRHSNQRTRAGPRWVCRRRAERDSKKFEAAGGLLRPVGRPVRKPGSRQPAVNDRRAAGSGFDLRPALHHVQFVPAGAAYLSQYSARCDGRHRRAVSARPALQHLSGGGIHRALRRRGSKRRRFDIVHSSDAFRRRDCAGSRPARRRNPLAARPDDGLGRESRFCPYGTLAWRGRRSAKAARDGGHRWSDHIHLTHLGRVARPLCLGGREKRK